MTAFWLLEVCAGTGMLVGLGVNAWLALEEAADRQDRIARYEEELNGEMGRRWPRVCGNPECDGTCLELGCVPPPRIQLDRDMPHGELDRLKIRVGYLGYRPNAGKEIAHLVEQHRLEWRGRK